MSNACVDLFEGMPGGVVVIYLVATAAQFLLFAHNDLYWTVLNSYAYLDGHILDFYDYNAGRGLIAYYLPLLYVVSAIWMLPAKLVSSLAAPAGPAGDFIPMLAGWEVAWAKLLLLIVFLISAHLLKLIAREALPGRPQAQRNATIAYLLSPFAAFSFGVFAQCDVIGVCLTLAGVLYYLRGDRWRFALLFGLAVSAKYFALIVFAPLLLLAYKRLRDLVLLSGVVALVVAVMALPYLPSSAFREHALLGLVMGRVNDTPGPAVLAVAIYLIGCIVLWRTRPTRPNWAPIAILAAATAYGLFFTAVHWHPYWFIMLAPFLALAVGLLRRPTRFIVWESIGFLVFVWNVSYTFPGNVDFNMVTAGPMRDALGSPMFSLGNLYPSGASSVGTAAMLVFCISPVAFWILELVEQRSPTPVRSVDEVVYRPAWYLRALTLPLLFTLPAILAVVLPVSVAEAFNPLRRSRDLASQIVCQPQGQATAYAGSAGAFVARQGFRPLHQELSGASVHIATMSASTGDTVEFVLRESAGHELSRTRVKLGRVLINGKVDVYFKHPIRVDPAVSYALEINTNAASGHFALLGTSSDCVANESLTIDGVVQPGDLGLTLYYARP